MLAGQLAYEQGRDVSAEDMHQAFRLMRDAPRRGRLRLKTFTSAIPAPDPRLNETFPAGGIL